MELEERTIGGLHDVLMNSIVPAHASSGGRALDLGAGSGALAFRIREMGLDVLASDIDPRSVQAGIPFRAVDLNGRNFAAQLGENAFDLVTAVEVIEHLESPIGFLRNVGRLLKVHGVAIVTTPNVDNLPTRVKFLLTGRLRMMDEQSDPTHIAPIFWDLLQRQYLPRAELELVAHSVYPPNGYKASRARYTWPLWILTHLLPGEMLVGDNHILVLRRGNRVGR